MLDGIRAGINTVTFGTPILGTMVFLLVSGTRRVRGEEIGWISRGIGGGLVGATVATGWEFTVNSSDRPEIKAEVIVGSAAIGAGAGVLFS
jgi:hypothetical protein